MESNKCISILHIVHLKFLTYLLVISCRGNAVPVLDCNTCFLHIIFYFAIQTFQLCDISNAWLLFQLFSPHGHCYCTSCSQQRHKDIIKRQRSWFHSTQAYYLPFKQIVWVVIRWHLPCIFCIGLACTAQLCNCGPILTKLFRTLQINWLICEWSACSNVGLRQFVHYRVFRNY